MIPFVIECFLSYCFIPAKSKFIVCEYLGSYIKITSKKKRFQPYSV